MDSDTVIAEDVLLLMLGDADGASAGSIDSTLGGAVLVELALRGQVRVGDVRARRDGTALPMVTATGDGAPADPLLRRAYEMVAAWPRRIPTGLPLLGAALRAPLVERLVESGLLHRERRGFGGLISTTRLPATERHESRLREQMRLVLELGADPAPRLTALIALVSASDTLPSLHPRPRWTDQVAGRAKLLEQGATADMTPDAAAVLRGVTATLSAASAVGRPSSGNGVVSLSLLVRTPTTPDRSGAARQGSPQEAVAPGSSVRSSSRAVASP